MNILPSLLPLNVFCNEKFVILIVRITTEITTPKRSIGNVSHMDTKQNQWWKYDPWLRQYSAWFTCRANGRKEYNLPDVVYSETSVRVYAYTSTVSYKEYDGRTSYSNKPSKASRPIQLGQGINIISYV